MKSRWISALLLTLVVAMGARADEASSKPPEPGPVVPVTSPRTVTGFLNETATRDGVSLPYVVYVPRDYTPERAWPVILFLHGAGERGGDGLKQSQVGLGRVLRLFSERYPAVVVMPQCPADQGWNKTTLPVAIQALDQTLAQYRIDPRRQYLTGLSMGGYGSWKLAAEYPDRWAAVAPICGGGDPKEMPARIRHLPTWVFHGAKDTVVPPEHSREMVEALQQVGSTTVRYTEYPEVGHNCWDKVYDDPEFAQWLFGQQVGKPETNSEK